MHNLLIDYSYSFFFLKKKTNYFTASHVGCWYLLFTFLGFKMDSAHCQSSTLESLAIWPFDHIHTHIWDVGDPIICLLTKLLWGKLKSELAKQKLIHTLISSLNLPFSWNFIPKQFVPSWIDRSIPIPLFSSFNWRHDTIRFDSIQNFSGREITTINKWERSSKETKLTTGK